MSRWLGEIQNHILLITESVTFRDTRSGIVRYIRENEIQRIISKLKYPHVGQRHSMTNTNTP